MSEQTLPQLLSLAKDAARSAGEAVLAIYQSGRFEAFNKADESPVTTADYRANDILQDKLISGAPAIPIISEEQNNGVLAEREHWQRYWLLDPIDGTQEFISRSGDFAVCIALVQNNHPVIGVIYWPVKDTLYFASKGSGAFRQNGSQIQPLRVRPLSGHSKEPLNLAISRVQDPNRVLSLLADDCAVTTSPLGSCALKACSVAEGSTDLFVRLGKTGEWDTGAAQCIVEQAGGQIRALDLSPLTYNRRDSLNNPDFVVTGDSRIDWSTIIKPD